MSTEESFQTENDSQPHEDEYEYSYVPLSHSLASYSHTRPPPVDELSQMIAEMHLRGINVRYLLQIYSHLTNEKVRQFVLTEALARTVKHEIEGLWRSITSIDDTEYGRVLVQYLNKFVFILFSPSLHPSPSFSLFFFKQLLVIDLSVFSSNNRQDCGERA